MWGSFFGGVRTVFWERPLTYPIELKDGTIATLREAGEAASTHFAGTLTDSLVEIAIHSLMTAANSGRNADILTATRSLHSAFEKFRVLKSSERPRRKKR